MCSLKYPEVTILSIAHTAAAALTTSAFTVLKGYRKKGNALAKRYHHRLYSVRAAIQLPEINVPSELPRLAKATTRRILHTGFIQKPFTVDMA